MESGEDVKVEVEPEGRTGVTGAFFLIFVVSVASLRERLPAETVDFFGAASGSSSLAFLFRPRFSLASVSSGLGCSSGPLAVERRLGLRRGVV